MNTSRKIFSFLIAILCLSQAIKPVQAVTIPDFQSCPFPGGETIASYSSGSHGVPGDYATYYGEDVVYKLNDAQVVQCLCTDEGQGVQTWWWKQPDLTAEDESILNKDGWVRVPNGALWGLDATVWFAKNTYYSCDGRGGVLGASTSRGQVLGASTFAATGDMNLPALLAGVGLVMLVLSVTVKSVRISK